MPPAPDAKVARRKFGRSSRQIIDGGDAVCRVPPSLGSISLSARLFKLEQPEVFFCRRELEVAAREQVFLRYLASGVAIFSPLRYAPPSLIFFFALPLESQAPQRTRRSVTPFASARSASAQGISAARSQGRPPAPFDLRFAEEDALASSTRFAASSPCTRQVISQASSFWALRRWGALLCSSSSASISSSSRKVKSL